MANTLRQLKRATEIVERYRARGNIFPREFRDCGRGDPEHQQEYRDACKVKTWKYSLLGKNMYNCSDEIRDYLDENMPGWRDRVYSHHGQSSNVQMKKAEQIVVRYRERGNVLPRRLKDPTKAQETKDAICISTWKSSLKGYNRTTCSPELCAYLDENMPGWRIDHHKSKPRSALGKEKALRALIAGTTTGELEKYEKSTEVLMPMAIAIVERFRINNNVYPSLKLKCRQDPSRTQEYDDAKKLHDWKSHVDRSFAPEVFEYLDRNMPDWTNSHVAANAKNRKNTPVSKAREIVKRCSMRRGALPRLIPREHQVNPELILEHKDAVRLREWKTNFLKDPEGFCKTLRSFLDEKLSNWIHVDIDHANFAEHDIGNNHMHSLHDGRKRNNCQFSTDEEASSIDDYDDYDNAMQNGLQGYACASKRIKKQHHGMESDENASIAALLQLGSNPGMGPAFVTPVPVEYSKFYGYAPPPLTIQQPAVSFSTYGNKTSSKIDVNALQNYGFMSNSGFYLGGQSQGVPVPQTAPCTMASRACRL